LLESTLARLVWIAAVAIAAHLATVLIRGGSRRLLRSRVRSEAKVLTVTGFATSVIVFGIYFAAFGFLLSELGISLTTYLASASVIGLAVSFGSQGVVQDVITGLTVVFSDLIDVGDMVDIGGQVGIVESVGMRFTVIVNFAGAHVFVPNRAIGNVINYPQGYIRAYLDARLPEDPSAREEAERRLSQLALASFSQYPGILLRAPTVEGRVDRRDGASYLRIKFRIWPGQGALLEGPVKAAAAQTLRSLDERFQDWMVTVHYRSEPLGGDPRKRLPRPAALRRERAEAPGDG
jgi:small conductance mechanosensitive channel